MERLKDEVLHNAIIGYKAECKFGYPTALDKVTLEFLYELKNYRDLEEQGLLLKLPTVKVVPLSEIYRVIAGHSNYHGDSILSALTCIAEGKEVKPIKPLEE